MAQLNYYIGVISKIIDPDLYTIEVEIPEENMELKAFPIRGELDEPRVGDVVILRELDPVYHSYYLYEKLKENPFIGIRSRGKVVKMSVDDVTIGIFDPSDEAWYDANDGVDPTPAPTSWIKIDSEGNIDVMAEGNQNINITGDSTVKVGGNSTVEVSGNVQVKVSGDANVEVSGNTTVKSPNVKVESSGTIELTGGGEIKTGPSAPGAPSTTGPFNCIPNCIFSGVPHCTSSHSGI